MNRLWMFVDPLVIAMLLKKECVLGWRDFSKPSRQHGHDQQRQQSGTT